MQREEANCDGNNVADADGKNEENEQEQHKFLPLFFAGKVIKGWGRGGKQLHCPTANLDAEALISVPEGFPDGVYAGFARVDGGELWPMVMSIGYNPHFHNAAKSLEVHLLHDFPSDFYGSRVDGVALSHLRPMREFNSLAELVEAIQSDKEAATALMADAEKKRCLEEHPFFATKRQNERASE